jgi:hypothetical protein
MMTPILLACLASLGLPAPEPAPRRLTPLPLRVEAPLPNVSAARELPDGRVLVTDFRLPAVYLLNPATGVLQRLGSSGVGPNQYVQPGGLYGGPDGTTLILDRSQARVLVVAPDGTFTRTYSIAVNGTSSSSDRDLDRQHLDARGLAYFTDDALLARARFSGQPTNEVDLVRFDATTQRKETVTRLLAQLERIVPGGDGVTYGRTVIGSPADGWGVTPEGRVAIVRAVPYRIEWISPAGKLTRGPAVSYDPVPMTDAEKQAFSDTHKGGSVGAGLAGSTSTSADMGPIFARTKAPFERDDVMVSPGGRVWVMRCRPLAMPEVIYDVFDDAGARIDRVEFPALSRVIGFGKTSVFVREGGGAGPVVLKKYSVQ